MSWKEILCHVNAIPSFVRHGFDHDFYNPHDYVENKVYHSNIWITDEGFRIANDSLHHYPGERFVANARITELVCKRCGKRIAEWDNGDVTIITK